MADIQHSSLQHPDVHEPRWITLNGTGASGNVITNSSSTSGISEYRRLSQDEIDDVLQTIPVFEIDSSTGVGTRTHYLAMPFQGSIVNWYAVVDNPLVAGSNTYELRINGVQVTGTPITFNPGGSAGDSLNAAATGNEAFNTGDNIEVVSTAIGNTDATVDTRFLIEIRRA